MNLWVICFLPYPPTLPFPFISAISSSSSHQDDGFCKRSCHIPPLNLTQDTCLLWRMRCVMKASFLWENWLSSVTSFPSLELITVASPITPVVKVLARMGWQEPLWSGWVGGVVLILSFIGIFRRRNVWGCCRYLKLVKASRVFLAWTSALISSLNLFLIDVRPLLSWWAVILSDTDPVESFVCAQHTTRLDSQTLRCC